MSSSLTDVSAHGCLSDSLHLPVNLRVSKQVLLDRSVLEHNQHCKATEQAQTVGDDQQNKESE